MNGYSPPKLKPVDSKVVIQSPYLKLKFTVDIAIHARYYVVTENGSVEKCPILWTRTSWASASLNLGNRSWHLFFLSARDASGQATSAGNLAPQASSCGDSLGLIDRLLFLKPITIKQH
jgi:hypothetical protein